MRKRLNELVIFTCIAFVGILGILVYSLYYSYYETKARVLSELSTTMSGLAPKYQAFVSSRSTLLNQTGGAVTSATVPGKSSLHDDENYRHLQKKINQPTTTFPLKRYKKELEQSLTQAGVKLPVEVAVIDAHNKIISSTTTASDFSSVKFKTPLNQASVIHFPGDKAVYLQVAVPHLSRLAFIRKLPLSIVAAVFVIFCMISLIYMFSLLYRQKRLSQIRNDLMNNMTHELKTPISSATVALGLLKDDTMGLTMEQKVEYFQIAENELKRLALLVDKVLKIAAFEKQEIEIRPQYFPVKPWIDTIVKPLTTLLSARGAKLTVTVYPETLKIWADRANMNSVLQNLLDNAIKYADPKKDHLIIQITGWQNDTDYFIAVQDNGIGIPFYHQERIFDKFFRVPTGDEHETKGYGLGLSYVQQIIKLHGGGIEVDSTYHMGTRFKLRIPKKRA